MISTQVALPRQLAAEAADRAFAAAGKDTSEEGELAPLGKLGANLRMWCAKQGPIDVPAFEALKEIISKNDEGAASQAASAVAKKVIKAREQEYESIAAVDEAAEDARALIEPHRIRQAAGKPWPTGAAQAFSKAAQSFEAAGKAGGPVGVKEVADRSPVPVRGRLAGRQRSRPRS